MEVADTVEPTIHEEDEVDLIDTHGDAGKKLDAALGLDDPSKKKIQPNGKKDKTSNAKTSKKTNNNVKTKTGAKKKAGNASSVSDIVNKSGKKANDVISEEQYEEDSISAIQAAADMIVDPDIKMIEEYNNRTANEQSKWENILDVSDVINKKDTRNTYIMACKVLGVIPVSTMIDSLSSSEIKLAHYGIGAKGAQALAKSLDKNTTVAILDLENNWIMSGGIAIASTLINNRFITHLNLADNRLGRECAAALSEMIQYNITLEEINLRGNQLSDKEIETISTGLLQNSTLKDLSHNDFGDMGITSLGACLSKNDRLENLNLSWNKIRTKGFFTFFNFIKDNSSLLDLNLESNGIGENATSISTFLSRCSLQSLNLASNRIADNLIQIIAKGLESNSSLINLDVSYNVFTDKGAAAFLKTLLNNNSIQKLNIQGVRLSKESLSKIAELKNEKSDLIIMD